MADFNVTVCNTDGGPAPGSCVCLHDADFAVTYDSAIADDSGVAAFRDVPDGDYTLRADGGPSGAGRICDPVAVTVYDDGTGTPQEFEVDIPLPYNGSDSGQMDGYPDSFQEEQFTDFTS